MGQKSLVDCNSYISFNDLMVSNKRCQLDIFIIVIERYAFQFRKGYLHFYINKKSVKVEKILRDFKLLFDWFRIRQCYIVVGNYLHVWLMFEKLHAWSSPYLNRWFEMKEILTLKSGQTSLGNRIIRDDRKWCQRRI